MKVPKGYPEEAMKELEKFLGEDSRHDIAQLVKGGFGLPESPRLWYLEYKQTLLELGGRELRLVPGFFCFYNKKGELHGMACIHVDDTRYAGAPSAEPIWRKLHEKLKFGQKRKATEGWTKFCGRYERQDPVTMEFELCMDEYVKDIPLVTERKAEDISRPLDEGERKMISSVIGQVNWAAHQCRYDLSFAASHCQQLAGQRNPEALAWVNKVVRRAKNSMIVKMVYLDCPIDEAVVLSVSDTAFAAQPGAGSQGGLLVGLANPKIEKGVGPIVIVEGSSCRLQRVVRYSMSAELSQTATAYEHGDYVQAILAEIMGPRFSLRAWKFHASRWRHLLVFDAKVAYDALQSDNSPTDRKLIIDIAVLREALQDPQACGYIRWVSGREIPSDGLTKWNANGALE